MRNVLFLLITVLLCFTSGCNESTIRDCSDEINELLETVKSSNDSKPPSNSSSCAKCGADCMILEIECMQTCVEEFGAAYELFISCMDNCHDDFTSCLDGCE